MSERKPSPVAIPAPVELTFRGLDLCGGCGARLDPEDRLWGLCPACARQNATEAIAGQETRPERAI